MSSHVLLPAEHRDQIAALAQQAFDKARAEGCMLIVMLPQRANEHAFFEAVPDARQWRKTKQMQFVHATMLRRYSSDQPVVLLSAWNQWHELIDADAKLQPRWHGAVEWIDGELHLWAAPAQATDYATGEQILPLMPPTLDIF